MRTTSLQSHEERVLVNHMDRLRPWITLKLLPGIGDVTLYPLLTQFGSPDRVFEATPQELAEIGGCTKSQIQAIIRGPDHGIREAVDRELTLIDRSKVTVLTCMDSAYPASLRTIHDPPVLLYLTGQLDSFDAPCIAFVGSRRATPLGIHCTEQWSQELAALGVTIVSGLARGVDAAAHRGALAAGGRTIAVLGCGIDRTYPPEHTALRHSIEEGGTVLSEFPMQAPPHAHHFPKRNRIISGLSLGVVVTQATRNSGSLITARLAAEQGREVFAVPGSIKEEQSRGPHELIRQGARLVETVQDILEELAPQLKNCEVMTPSPPMAQTSPTPVQLKEDEAVVYQLLSDDPTLLDDLIVKSGLGAGTLNGLLVSMELKGIIRCLPGARAVRV